MKKTVTALRPTARVSWKDSVKIFRKIKGKHTEKAKNILNDLINQKIDIEKKYYTGASKEILSLIEEAENNAESLELNRDKLYLKEAVVNKAFTYMLPKSRFSHRGRRAKICQLKVTLEER